MKLMLLALPPRVPPAKYGGCQTVLDAKARNANLQTGSLQTGGARQQHVTGKVRSLRAATRLAGTGNHTLCCHTARPVRSATLTIPSEIL